jgi:hypothetical protein
VVVKVSSGEHTRLLRAVGALDDLERHGRVLHDLTAALSLARVLAMSGQGPGGVVGDQRTTTITAPGAPAA